MIPMDKVAVLSLTNSWEQNLAVIRARRFSRYPLCADGLKSVIGFVHIKDLLIKGVDGRPPDLKSIRRDLAAISTVDNLEKHLKVFPDMGIHMALVKNAKGVVVGVLTLEDIIEEIIGEVHDEFDLREAWNLVDVVAPAAVAVQLHAEDTQSAIWQLLNKLKVGEPELDTREAFQAIWNRERKLSSGVGRGMAVPHARLASLDRPLVALGRFSKPVPFVPPDNIPVRLVFLILTPTTIPIPR